MAPRKGSNKAPNRVSAAKAAANDEEGQEKVGFIPADPADPRLTIQGVVLDANGKIDIEAYEDIMACWASEPSPDKHPDPLQPGVRSGEEVPKGLRMWDDVRAGAIGKDGAGWIAVKTSVRLGKKEKWFNIRSCRSWRLAFLFAKLQRAVWEREDVPMHLQKGSRSLCSEPTTETPKASPVKEAKATPVKRVKEATETPNKRAKLAVASGQAAKQSDAQLLGPTMTATVGGALSKLQERIRAKEAAAKEIAANAAVDGV